MKTYEPTTGHSKAAGRSGGKSSHSNKPAANKRYDSKHHNRVWIVVWLAWHFWRLLANRHKNNSGGDCCNDTADYEASKRANEQCHFCFHDMRVQVA